MAQEHFEEVGGLWRIKGSVVVPHSGRSLTIPDSLVDRVKEFLLEIDGKGASDKPGKDYEGLLVSEAEVRFKLGK